jgi:hypothetical protein
MPDVIVIALGRPRLRLMSWFLREAGVDAADSDGADVQQLATLASTGPLVVLNTVAHGSAVASFIKELRVAVPGARVAAMHPGARDDGHADVDADICIYHAADVDGVVEAVQQYITAERA